ncbi:MAG: winged helix-turn-helix domain-containing protein [Chloroflexi bacterium]|nr:winged helix-turn-helix domain-containing protein [Chloroflexota bacterium]
MPDQRDNPTDAAICRLLTAGPLPTAELVARLGIPARTARHRLYRLRQAGAVIDDGGRHRLAAQPADPEADLAAPGAAALAAPAAPGRDLAAPPASGSLTPAAAAATGTVPALAGSVVAVAVVIALAAATWAGVPALRRRLSAIQATPQPPSGSAGPTGYPWGGGVPWSW